MRYGYARVSTLEQDLSVQIEVLKKAGCKIIRKEKVSGNNLNKMNEINILMDFLQYGDELVVTRIDRLARSMLGLQTLVQKLREKGVQLIATEQPIDTTTSSGKAFLDMLGVFAEFETNLRKERQAEGIAKAKAKGVYTGKKSTIDKEKLLQLKREGKGTVAIARALNCDRTTVYRALKVA